MEILKTISPIFVIIAFGYFLKNRKLLSDGFISEANRFIYLFPLPFLIFTGIVRADARGIGWLSVLSITLPTLAVIGIALVAAAVGGYRTAKLGSFVQSTFHGNVTYVGLAVIFYLLGEKGLERGSLLVGILILFNNALAVLILSLASGKHRSLLRTAISIITTPVIIATFAGMVLVLFQVRIPSVLMKSIGIVANIALPMALIIIGGSISLSTLTKTLRPAIIAALLKVIVLPGLAVLLCHVLSIDFRAALPAIILLATPTAITTYIMARELGGDTLIASGTITLTTLVSPVTYLLWIWMLETF